MCSSEVSTNAPKPTRHISMGMDCTWSRPVKDRYPNKTGWTRCRKIASGRGTPPGTVHEGRTRRVNRPALNKDGCCGRPAVLGAGIVKKPTVQRRRRPNGNRRRRASGDADRCRPWEARARGRPRRRSRPKQRRANLRKQRKVAQRALGELDNRQKRTSGDEVADSVEAAVEGGKRASVGPTQEGTKQTLTATEENGVELRKMDGPDPTGENKATEHRLSHIIHKN